MLLALLVISMTLYLLVFRQGPEEKPEVIYQKNLDDARGVEQLLLEQAAERDARMDELAK
jgi:hypothetical protein